MTFRHISCLVPANQLLPLFRFRATPTLTSKSEASCGRGPTLFRREMNGLPPCSHRRFGKGFRDSWVRMNGGDQLFKRRLQAKRQAPLRNHVRCGATNHVNTQHLVILLVRDDLDHPSRIVRNDALAISRQGKTPNLNLVAALRTAAAIGFVIAIGLIAGLVFTFT